MAVPAKAKLSEGQVKTIRRRERAGELITDLALEYDVNRRTIRRRLDALDQADRERAQRRSARRAEEKRMKRLLGSAYRNPARAPEHQPATRAARGAPIRGLRPSPPRRPPPLEAASAACRSSRTPARACSSASPTTRLANSTTRRTRSSTTTTYST